MTKLGVALAVVAVGTLAACGADHRPGGGGGGGDGADGGMGSNIGSGSDPGGGSGVTASVYAQTATTLFKIDPDTFDITKIGDFQFSAGPDQMTDIAIDKTGLMIGISFTAVYRVDTSTAVATQLTASLDQSFNGMSFVPATMLGMTGDDVLVATRNTDGQVFRIDPSTGQSTSIGDMGGAFTSSGDLVAVDGFGTLQTVPGDSGDELVTLAANSFAATAAPMPTGFGSIWGIAFWGGKVFGFSDDGSFLTIDATTGVGTLVSSSSNEWWGAAVTTTAPIFE